MESESRRDVSRARLIKDGEIFRSRVLRILRCIDPASSSRKNLSPFRDGFRGNSKIFGISC